MRRSRLLASCGLVLALGAGMVQASEAGVNETQGLPGLRAYWERTVLSLAPWAPETTYERSTGATEFTGAQGRRLQATVILPPAGCPVRGAVLHLDADAQTLNASSPPADRGIVRMYFPSTSQEDPPQRALLDTYRAVSVLLSVPELPAGKLALEGRGEAAALALALAALRPGEVGAVVLVKPQAPAQSTDHWDLTGFARLVRCPTLLVSERGSAAGPVVAALAAALGGPQATAVVTNADSADYWPWIAALFARPQESSPAARGADLVEYEGGLPVDLSRQ
jgi:hypothetical protein